MPYRRLPNTDKARLAALEKAVAMEHECDVDKQAASYKTLNEARVLLRRFKSAVEQFQYCYTAPGRGQPTISVAFEDGPVVHLAFHTGA